MAGEAFKDINYSTNERNLITLLGIANWHTVRGKESLLNSPEIGSHPKEYDVTTSKNGPDEMSDHINPNHSHFLLVDTGKINEFGGEIQFRTRVEKTLALFKGEKMLIHNKKMPMNKFKSSALTSNLSVIMLEAISKNEENLLERVSLDVKIDKMRAEKNHIPAVVLVIGGGFYTLAHVLESLKNEFCCVFFEVKKLFFFSNRND